MTLTCRCHEAGSDMTIIVVTTDAVLFSSYQPSTAVTTDFDMRMLFNGVTSNVGGGYDIWTGAFTCPTSGYYYFYVHAYVGMTTDKGCVMKLVHNTTRIATVRYRQVYYRKIFPGTFIGCS